MKTTNVRIILFIFPLTVPTALRAQPASTPADRNPLSLRNALASQRDLWGEAAIARPEGPTYEFFRDLLPPLRYVNAAFRHYPIVLSAPGALIKPRLVSNGSGINRRANLKTWHEIGTPVSFQVGQQQESFGADLDRLEGPHYLEGHLPIVQMAYRQNDEIYEQEVFAPIDGRLAADGILFVRFSCPEGGVVTARLEQPGVTASRPDENGGVVLTRAPNWNWDTRQNSMRTDLAKGESAFLCVLTRPCKPADSPHIDADIYQQHRDACIRFWRDRLAAGTQIEVPEPIVNDAWRSLIIGTQMLIKGREMCYSAGNAYEREYECESGDAVRALLLYGHAEQARALLGPLLDYRQRGLASHDAAFKLQLLAHYYWLTRDREAILSHRAQWEAEVKRIVDGRQSQSGLLPPENYCGDINTQVHTLTSNSSAWRGLRDIASVLRDMSNGRGGPTVAAVSGEADRLAAVADEFRTAIRKAVDQSVFRKADPPFVPVALFGKEQPPTPITGSTLGSYWNLVVPYVLDSGVFGPDAPQERWIMDYIQQRGGLCMGMIRFDQHSGLFANEKGLDDCYTLRYMLTQMRRDEPDRSIVTFYGKLAQGLTRDTFIGAEGTGLEPLDPHGRPMYLPPNCTGNSLFLWTLRYMLVQDWDLDDDGASDTLRLLYTTPRSWLEDGRQIVIKNAPTAFGPLSLTATSEIKRGRVVIHVDPLSRPARQVLLRLRLPTGWKADEVERGNVPILPESDAVLDLSTQTLGTDVVVKVKRTP